MKHKKFWLWIVSIIAIVSVICVGAGFYFFNVACVPSHKSFVSANSDVVKKTDPLYKQKKWYYAVNKEKWYMSSADRKYKLDANYIPNKESNKTAVLLHGYMNNKNTMAPYLCSLS